MSSMFDTLAGQILQGGQIEHLSRQLGTTDDQTRIAVGAALPTLLGALAKNATRPGGAAALHGALSRDHDGSVLDDLAGFLQKSDTADGDGILRHVLGDRRQTVEQGLGKGSGLDAEKMSRTLAMLAPLVMGYLGKQRRERSLDSRSLGSLLGDERSALEQRTPETGILTRLIDKDGDGSVVDDIAGTLTKKLFGRG